MSGVRGTSGLEVQTVASGSSGNMAIIRHNHAVVVLDFGLSSQRGIMDALSKVGVRPDAVEAFVVSHAHSDHLNYPGIRVAIENGVPILAGSHARRRAVEIYRSRLGRELPRNAIHDIKDGVTYLVAGLEMTPFLVPHDVPTYGFEFVTSGLFGRRRLVIATDLGCVPDQVLTRFCEADALLLEANYNDELLASSPRHPEDKARVASDEGHLSNAQAGGCLRQVMQSSRRLPKAVLLVHLSRDHNEPELAKAEVAKVSRLKPDALLVAPRASPGPRIVV